MLIEGNNKQMYQVNEKRLFEVLAEVEAQEAQEAQEGNTNSKGDIHEITQH